MTRLMYDAVDWTSIPMGAELVGGYLDGALSRWPAEAWAAFPNATFVHIVTSPYNNAGEVLDVEWEDATAAEAVDWIINRRNSGLLTPTIYCGGQQGYSWAEVLANCYARGVPPPLIWLARWVNGGAPPTFVPEGCIAQQYDHPPFTGTNYDVSIAADYWPGVDPAPDPLDPMDALAAIRTGRNLLAQASSYFEHAEEDLTPP